MKTSAINPIPQAENLLVVKEAAIQRVCASILDTASAPKQLDRSFIVDCVVSAVAVYFNTDKSLLYNFKKRGQISELRGICYYILGKRHSPNFTYAVIADYFKSYPSKVCILHNKTRDRLQAKLYNLDVNVGIIERNINAVIKQYEVNLQNNKLLCK